MTRSHALLAFGSVCLFAPVFTGCATITRGTSEVLVVESEPSGATIRLSNGMVGTTPTSFKIHRKGAVTVSVFKEGYESSEIIVNTQVAKGGAAGMAGNVLVGGLIGVGVDSFSGGMLEHKPNPVQVTLVAKETKPPSSAGPGAATEVAARPGVAAVEPQEVGGDEEPATPAGESPAVAAPVKVEATPEAPPTVATASDDTMASPGPIPGESATGTEGQTISGEKS